MSNPNDLVRMQILRYFYDRNKSAKSRAGKQGSCVKISQVKKDLKDLYGLSQSEVQSNLNYLMDKGWVKEVVQERTYFSGRTNYPSPSKCYEISADGIDKIEGDSEFASTGKFAGININAIGSVVTLGDGNVVQAEYAPLGHSLEALKSAVVSSQLPENEKISIFADIDALQSQLVKSNPNKAVIAALWESISKAADIEGLTHLVRDVGVLLSGLIG